MLSRSLALKQQSSKLVRLAPTCQLHRTSIRVISTCQIRPRRVNSVTRCFSSSTNTNLASQVQLPFTANMSPAAYKPPPVSPPKWDYTPQQITSTVTSAIAKTDSLLDSLAGLPKEDRTFDSVARALALREAEHSIEIEPALFLQYVSTQDAVRDASVEADKLAQEFELSSITRLDVYDALKDAEEHTLKNKVELNSEEKRLLERLLLDRKRNGLALRAGKRDQLLKLKTEIMNLEVDFQKKCNEEDGFLLFTKEELEGVGQEVIDGFPVVDGKLKVTHKTPDIIPVQRSASLPETRKRAVLSYEGKTKENAPTLEKVANLRRQAAQLLGYKNHAEYILEVKMAKTPETVLDFLSDLETKLRPLGEAEKKTLLELKEEEYAARGWEFDGELYLWDRTYYERLHLEKTLALDDDEVKKYFPVAKVVPTILNMYQELLGVSFVAVPRTEEAGGQTWHEEAEAYAVWDKETFIGYMYLDLFPRQAKYGHAAVWGLMPGFVKADGERTFPVVNMVANLAKPVAGKPATMKHTDVVTFFHEMGHALHGLCSKTQFARFHGTAVARDFVEAPSQMLENWCWTKGELKAMSSHVETGEPLPDQLIDAIIASKKVGQGLFNLRQIFHGLFDMQIHTKTEAELPEFTKLWCDLRESTSLVSGGGNYVAGQGGFAHLVGGYSAGYYGYLYSQAFSADMFATVFESSPMDKAAGAKYRQEILLPGGSRDEMDSLKAFLGREPSNKAFMESLLGEQ